MIMFSTEDRSSEIFQHNNRGAVPAPHTSDLYLTTPCPSSPKPSPCGDVPTGDTRSSQGSAEGGQPGTG